LTHAGVLFFRLPGAGLKAKVEQLSTVLAEYRPALARGEFVVVTPSHIRIADRSHA